MINLYHKLIIYLKRGIAVVACLLAFLLVYHCTSTDAYSATDKSAKFIIIYTLCGNPVEIVYSVDADVVYQEIDIEDKYSLMNLRTFLTVFKSEHKTYVPLDIHLYRVARINC